MCLKGLIKSKNSQAKISVASAHRWKKKHSLTHSKDSGQYWGLEEKKNTWNREVTFGSDTELKGV